MVAMWNKICIFAAEKPRVEAVEALRKNDIQDVATYCGLVLLKEGMTVTPLKLQKILYYVQAWMMVFFDKQLLFEDQPQAWVNGPVYPSVYERFKTTGRYTQLKKEDFITEGVLTDAINAYADKLALTPNQINVLNKLVLIYGSKNQDQLVFMTHCEMPWSIARGDLEPFENSETPISFEDMYDFYKKRYETNRKARD